MAYCVAFTYMAYYFSFYFGKRKHGVLMVFD